jgi:integrase
LWQTGTSRWRIRWRQNGRIHERGFSSKEVAEAVLNKAIADRDLGLAGIPPDPRSTAKLGDHVEEWFASRKVAKQTDRTDRSRWAVHLAPSFGSSRTAEVTPGGVARFVREAEGRMDRETVRKCVYLLSGFFGYLMEEGYATTSPIWGLSGATRRRLRLKKGRRPAFVERYSDIASIVDVLPEPVNIAYALGAYAGLRPGEIRSLNWADVDLERRSIEVRVGLNGQPKDEEPRLVPIVDALLPFLHSWQQRTGSTGLVVPPLRKTHEGNPIGGGTLRSRLKAALAFLGLPQVDWYHATRHTFASHWILRGGSPTQLRLILGHESVLTTVTYVHLTPKPFDAEALAVFPAPPIASETTPAA